MRAYNRALLKVLQMRKGINYAGIATKAGLPSKQVMHFLDGVYGQTTEILFLQRHSYDALQRAIEGALGEDDQAGYLTGGIPTPLYKSDHQRAKIMGKLFDASQGGPRSYSVSTERGFQEQLAQFAPEQIAALITNLTRNIPRFYAPSITLTPTDWRTDAAIYPPMVNYLALPGITGRVAIAFHAPQSEPDSISLARGQVIFGDVAQEMFTRVEDEWVRHSQEWGAHKIIELIERKQQA